MASSGGFSANLPTVVAASGNSSSTTQSAISGGTIIIRDEEGQRALTGKTAAETIAALNRDTSDTLNALKPIFDKEKIEAGFEIASEASRQLGQFLTCLLYTSVGRVLLRDDVDIAVRRHDQVFLRSHIGAGHVEVPPRHQHGAITGKGGRPVSYTPLPLALRCSA